MKKIEQFFYIFGITYLSLCFAVGIFKQDYLTIFVNAFGIFLYLVFYCSSIIEDDRNEK